MKFLLLPLVLSGCALPDLVQLSANARQNSVKPTECAGQGLSNYATMGVAAKAEYQFGNDFSYRFGAGMDYCPFSDASDPNKYWEAEIVYDFDI